MALGPISSPGAPTPPPAPSRDVTVAQRAFFQAALGQPAPVAAPAPAAPRPAPTPVPQSQPPAAPAAAPKAAYRPGSRLDIRI